MRVKIAMPDWSLANRHSSQARCQQKNTLLTDGEHGYEVRDARVFDQLGPQAIKNQPALVEASGEYGMVLTEGAVAYQDYSQIVNRKAGIPQRDVFGDRVVLAIAFSRSKGGKRRAPAIDLAILRKIRNKSDGCVDAAVGLIKPSAARL
jgi:hypothetical protein